MEKKKRLVLTSLNQVISVVKKNQKLRDLPKFSPIKSGEVKVAGGCSKCGTKSSAAEVNVSKQTVENILSSLTNDDLKQIKTVLELDEFCYYIKDRVTKKLMLVCV